VATVSRLKIAENQSPKPQDRVFYSFNYYANVNQHVNLKFDLPISGVKVYRHILGFEKTFLDGNGSFGVRFPIDTVTANPNFASSSPVRTDTSTAAGDLSFFGKFIVAENPDNGSLISVGLAVGTPNGPSRFGGAEYLASLHSTTIQPFVGYIWNRDRFYIHGFTAIDTAASDRLATLVYNDIGLGYFLFQSDEPDDWLTAVVPTFEVHINSPLTHGDWNNTNDPGAIPNIVNLTYGINFGFNRGSILTFALATPVTGPRPFDFEAMLLLNVFYGRTRRLSQGTMPILGP